MKYETGKFSDFDLAYDRPDMSLNTMLERSTDVILAIINNINPAARPAIIKTIDIYYYYTLAENYCFDITISDDSCSSYNKDLFIETEEVASALKDVLCNELERFPITGYVDTDTIYELKKFIGDILTDLAQEIKPYSDRTVDMMDL